MGKNSTLVPPPSTNEGFVYNVIVDKTCELFEAEPYMTLIPKTGEISIDSDWFETRQTCQDDVGEMLVSFAKRLRSLTGKRFVIATKYNPMHDAESEADDGFGPWDESVVLKMYLADSVRLKNENAIDCSITATIRVAQKVSLDSANTLISQ